MIDIILGALCEVRLPSHYEAHGGRAADSAYHVLHGELPTCEPEESPGYVSSSDESEGKSRYCRKRWFC